MKLAFYFTLSALLHAIVLILPFPRVRVGERVAIPVTLVIEQIRTANGPMAERKDPIYIATDHPGATSNPQGPMLRTLSDEKNKILLPEGSPDAANKLDTPFFPKMEMAKEKTFKELGVRELAMSSPPDRMAPSTEETETVLATPSSKTSSDKEIKREDPGKSDEALTRANLNEWHPKELTEEEPTQESMIETASVDLSSISKNTPKRLPSSGADLNGSTSAGNPHGEELKGPVFIRANYVRMVKPEYPRQARKKGWEGTTVLRVLVDQRGHSKKIEISRSSGFETLDHAAVKAVEHWGFHPARYGARPVESWVKIPIVFRLVDRDRGSLLVNR
ncbi:MAG: energy transducer TonB [Candidatus Binatia bacterium]